MKNSTIRIIYLLITIAFLAVAFFLFGKVFREQIIYFHTPKEFMALSAEEKAKKVRIGGLVGKREFFPDNVIAFEIIEDGEIVNTKYQGELSPMFRVGQGVVAEGLFDGKIFNADKLLTKHDETYKPEDKNYSDESLVE